VSVVSAARGISIEEHSPQRLSRLNRCFGAAVLSPVGRYQELDARDNAGQLESFGKPESLPRSGPSQL
jgi:hypothetical protein